MKIVLNKLSLRQIIKDMKEEDGKRKRGGARAGAGRKKEENKRKATFYLTNEVLECIGSHSKGTRYPKNLLVNDLLFSALSSHNADFEYCPKCSSPTAYMPSINISGSLHLECEECGNKYTIEV